jgi:Cu(I)/Ag(I) efflux system membrane fusion protein
MSEGTPVRPHARTFARVLRAALIVGAIVLAVLGAAIGLGLVGERASVPYVCPMHLQIVDDGPASCPICGMDLVPAASLDAGVPTASTAHAPDDGGVAHGASNGGVASAPTVHVGASQAARLGFVSVAVRRQALARRVRAPARVEADANATTVVDVRVPGWIAGVTIASVGVRVRRGQTLATLNSPALFEAEQGLAAARDTAQALGTGGAGLVDAARARLAALGVPGAEIERVARGGAPATRLTLTAPRAGVVVALGASAGAYVVPGSALFTIADLRHVAVVAELTESDADALPVGTPVTITLTASPARALPGRVALLAPLVDPARRTRTIRVTLDALTSETPALAPGAAAWLDAEPGTRDGLVVPRDAVVPDGTRARVFVDVGGGHFAPRDVRTGAERDGLVEIVDGLREGERVATVGAFLLEAESRLRGSAP